MRNAGKRRRHADHLVPKIQNERLIIYTKNPCKTKKKSSSPQWSEFIQKIETWSWSIRWSENSSKFWKTRKLPGLLRVFQNLLEFSSTNRSWSCFYFFETRHNFKTRDKCMYVCMSDTWFGWFRWSFSRRASKGMRRERERERRGECKGEWNERMRAGEKARRSERRRRETRKERNKTRAMSDDGDIYTLRACPASRCTSTRRIMFSLFYSISNLKRLP